MLPLQQKKKIFLESECLPGTTINSYLMKQEIQEFDLSSENLGSWTSEFTRVTPSKPNQF